MKTIKRVIEDKVAIDYYLVQFETFWNQRCIEGVHDDCETHGCLDNEPSHISEIEPIIIKIDKNNYLSLGVENKDNTWNCESLWEGDTHDLRPRIFKTKRDALKHIKHTVDRFNNPSPWECFVKTA